MFSFSSPYRYAVSRRFAWRSIFVLFVMFCLSATLLFTGCDNGTTNTETEYVYPATAPDKLLGIWSFTGLYGTDYYTITSTTILYDDGYSGPVGGTIKYYEAFDAESGVIIFEYDKGFESSYAEEYGRFQGFYYTDFIADTSLKGGNAWDSSNADWDAGNYGDPAEQQTLAAAQAAFTLANRDRYLSYAGGPYEKQ